MTLLYLDSAQIISKWVQAHYRGFAWRGTQSYAHDFTPLLGFLFLQRGVEKTTKNVIILVCVLIFLSLGCSLALWYNLNQKFLDILLCFPYRTMGRGNQHGGRECDDLQNWLHMKLPIASAVWGIAQWILRWFNFTFCILTTAPWKAYLFSG